jgi:hypothetical protein
LNVHLHQRKHQHQCNSLLQHKLRHHRHRLHHQRQRRQHRNRAYLRQSDRVVIG